MSASAVNALQVGPEGDSVTDKRLAEVNVEAWFSLTFVVHRTGRPAASALGRFGLAQPLAAAIAPIMVASGDCAPTTAPGRRCRFRP